MLLLKAVVGSIIQHTAGGRCQLIAMEVASHAKGGSLPLYGTDNYYMQFA